MIIIQLFYKIFFAFILLVLIFGFQIINIYHLPIIIFMHFFFKINVNTFNYIKKCYDYLFHYDKYNNYNKFLKKYVDVRLKNNICFEAKLNKITIENIFFNNIKNHYLIFMIVIEKNINIQYKVNINSILTITLNKNNYYEIILDELFKKSYLFKNVDIYLKKSIKDFLYINNND